MERIINMGIQIVPLEIDGSKYELIDSAIEVIQKSGLNFRVTPFETVVEGEESVLYDLLIQIRDTCYLNGCKELLINTRFHSALDKPIYMNDKTEKF